jgi:hypothetical protein
MYPWYDSVWLTRYTRAKSIVARVRPDLLPEFVTAFRIFRTRPDFEVRTLERVFDEATMADIRRTVRALRPDELELHEARGFGRFVVHNHPEFAGLHRRLAPLVGEIAGEAVEPAYTFLGLYGHLGVCPPHVDSPQSKWTLDLCIDQSGGWPIHFSQVCPWPEAEAKADHDWEDRIKTSPSLRFTSCTLEPGQAVVFSGSSQWHYRDAIPRVVGRTYCELLFFHFVPEGSMELLRPERWAQRFGVPELSRA